MVEALVEPDRCRIGAEHEAYDHDQNATLPDERVLREVQRAEQRGCHQNTGEDSHGADQNRLQESAKQQLFHDRAEGDSEQCDGHAAGGIVQQFLEGVSTLGVSRAYCNTTTTSERPKPMAARESGVNGPGFVQPSDSSRPLPYRANIIFSSKKQDRIGDCLFDYAPEAGFQRRVKISATRRPPRFRSAARNTAAASNNFREAPERPLRLGKHERRHREIVQA